VLYTPNGEYYGRKQESVRRAGRGVTWSRYGTLARNQHLDGRERSGSFACFAILSRSALRTLSGHSK
jgi:hypothetical protein